MKKTIIAIVIIAVLAAGGFLYYRYQNAQAQAQTNYQTATLAMGDLTATVGATGTVHANQTTTVTWQTTGRIGKVNAQVGDKVSINQVLAELDASSLSQSIITARADLVTAQRNLDNLKNSDTARTQAQQALADAQKTLQDAKNDRYGKNLARVSQATLDSAQADLIIAKDSLKNAQENYDKFVNRPENDLMRAQAFNRLAQAQQKVDSDQYQLDWLLGRPDTIEVAQADAKVALAQSKLDDAQREWDRLKNGPDPKDIAAAQAKIDAIQASLALTQVKAPINGTVTDVNVMAGDQASATAASFRIDDLSRLLVDVQITEVDINRVKVGQPAKMTFDAILDKEYNGKVVEVSTFGTTQSGVVNFTVTVELTDADEAVRPGMTAAVNLTVQQLKDVLLVPNRAVRLQDGKRIVYLLDAGQLRTAEVTLGATSDTNTQIIRGDVKSGDVVVLNPPTSLLTAGRPVGMGSTISGGR
jgi:HlyD family secretion protein